MIDIETGDTIRQFNQGEFARNTRCHPYYIIEYRNADSQLIDMKVDEALVTAEQLKFSSDCRFIFASNGDAVDVYGASELQGVFD